ncbi:MAG: SDR family oxidoreductase [Hyphomicrobiaceae bacterium]
MNELNTPVVKAYDSIFRSGLFAGRVVVITGGGSGIGRCTAHELAALGARVALIGRKSEKLIATEAEIRAAGGEAAWWSLDIRDEAAVTAAVGEIITRFGRIDGLVNNAGGQYASDLDKISAKGFDAVVRSNLLGGFLMARECYTQWLRDHGGAIVNIVADMWNGMPTMGHSGAARAGMINLTETAAFEWAAKNVRVNAVAPGVIASSGMDTYPPERREYIRTRGERVPLGRFGTESEVSAAIVFLLSDASLYTTGTTLRIDGGTPTVRPAVPLKPRAPSDAAPQYQGFHLAETPKVLQGL